MAFIQLDDASASLEVSVFNETFETYRDRIGVDEVLVVEGKVQNDDFAGEGKVRIVADRLFSLAEARTRFARQLRITLNGQASGGNARAAALRLQGLLAPFTQDGTCPVCLNYRNAEALCELKLGDACRVRLEDALLDALGEWLRPESVLVEYP